MLAMDSATPLASRQPSSSLTTIASMLAPTEVQGVHNACGSCYRVR
jgi:hypothetical protein